MKKSLYLLLYGVVYSPIKAAIRGLKGLETHLSAILVDLHQLWKYLYSW